MGLTDVKYELIKNLLKEDEEEDKKYFGIGGNTYVKKTDVDSKGKAKPKAQRFTKDDSGNYKAVEDKEGDETGNIEKTYREPSRAKSDFSAMHSLLGPPCAPGRLAEPDQGRGGQARPALRAGPGAARRLTPDALWVPP